MGVKGCGPVGTMDSKTAEGFLYWHDNKLKRTCKIFEVSRNGKSFDSTKMMQLTDSSVEHLFGEIGQMDNSEALTVERFGYLYATSRLASLKRILSDQSLSTPTIVMFTTMAIKRFLQN